MNREDGKPQSRRPPGGVCSNIFGEAEPITKVTARSNPSFQSSIFNSENGSSEQKVTKTDVQKLSNVPMFNSEHMKVPLHGKSRNRITQSSVFVNDDYPENCKLEPGVSRKASTAYKSANASTKSTIFDACVTGDESNKLTKSSEFDPHSIPLSKAVSNTYKCSIDCEEAEETYLPSKRTFKDFNRSAMVGGTCDVNAENGRSYIMSSGTKTTELPIRIKENVGRSQNSLKLSQEVEEKLVIGDLWSNGARPSRISSSKRSSTNHFQSRVFELDDPSSPALLWSSDFQQSPLPSEKCLLSAKASFAKDKTFEKEL